MLMLKLTLYGTTAEVIINFESIQAMIERADGTEVVMLHNFKCHVNESIETITETVMRQLNGDNSFRSN